MIEVYGFTPSWGLPDISPFVTKLINYMTMTGVPFEYRMQPLDTLAEASPTAKMPFIREDGKQINDSTTTINYLKDKLDGHLSEQEKAVGLAFQRMVEENVYRSGIIFPRWRTPEVFSLYLPSFVPPGETASPELLEAMEAYRQMIRGASLGHGMGRREPADALVNLQSDLDALSAYLGDKPFFLGAEPTSYDATVYSTFRHLTDGPWDWEGSRYAASKTNLVAYAERMRNRYGV